MVDVTIDVADGPTTGRRRRRPSGEPPPLPREIDRFAVGWLIALVFWSSLWAWVFLSDVPARWITARDLEVMTPLTQHRPDWATPVVRAINRVGTSWLTPLVAWGTIVGGLIATRVRHVLLSVIALTVASAIQTVIAVEIERPRPLGIEPVGVWSGPPQPSRPIVLATTALVCAGLTLVPAGRRRRIWTWCGSSVIAIFGFAQVMVGVEHPTDVMAAATIGVAVPLLLYRALAPERVFPIRPRQGRAAHLDVGGARGAAIRAALERQLGVEALTIEPVALSGSAGSTPLKIVQADGPDLFGKLYARSHLRSDRSYKLWRTLVYGRLEDEHRYQSVRRLVQHEDHVLHMLRRAGIDSMEPLGIVEITPDREYLLVAEFLDDAVEIGQAEVSTAVIDAALAMIARLWDIGLAHRDIKSANVMVVGDRVHLVDLSFAEIRPSPWRQAVDLTNMMLVLALRSDPALVYERARLVFSDAELAEALAASRGVTMPSALRAEIKRDGRDLLSELRALAPRRDPIAIQRWSLRRVALMFWVVVVISALVSIFVDHHADIGLR